MKTVLLAVCGLTPQVITETLFALHQQGRLPNAVRVLTTRKGKEACHAKLFAGGDGHYAQFLSEYRIAPGSIDFNPRHIRVVADDADRIIEDIADEDDNEFFLQACMESAFAHTAKSDTAVYFSIAGGRKTMGACLTVAAQCYGRSQDRLFHVLVSPEFESSNDFFFPPNPPREIILHDSKHQPYRKNTRYARVNLIAMPFISIRDRLTPENLRRPESPAELMTSLVREEKPRLTVDLAAGKIEWMGRECDMMPAHLALYGFLALVKKEAECKSKSCRGCSNCLITLPDLFDRQAEIVTLYRKTAPKREIEAMSRTGITGLDAENFRSYRAKIYKAFERCFGPAASDHIEIVAVGKRPETRYGLKLEKDRIRIVL